MRTIIRYVLLATLAVLGVLLFKDYQSRNLAESTFKQLESELHQAGQRMIRPQDVRSFMGFEPAKEVIVRGSDWMEAYQFPGVFRDYSIYVMYRKMGDKEYMTAHMLNEKPPGW